MGNRYTPAPVCGRESGYMRHIKRQQTACQPCREAHRAAFAAMRAAAREVETAVTYEQLAQTFALPETILHQDWRFLPAGQGPACVNHADVFMDAYGEGSGTAHKAAIKEARTVCSTCPVFAQCKADGDARETQRSSYGVLAGETGKERIARRSTSGKTSSAAA